MTGFVRLHLHPYTVSGIKACLLGSYVSEWVPTLAKVDPFHALCHTRGREAQRANCISNLRAPLKQFNGGLTEYSAATSADQSPALFCLLPILRTDANASLHLCVVWEA